MKFPSKPEEFNLVEGVTFEVGVISGITIQKLVVHPGAIYLDGTDDTETSKYLLEGIFEWLADEFKMNYTEKTVRRWAFISDVVFESDFPLLEYQNPVLREIGLQVGDIVRKNLKEDLHYQPTSISVSHDPTKRSAGIAPFSIQHRLGSPYEDNMFFSEAPVPTKAHLAFIKNVENEFRKNYEGR